MADVAKLHISSYLRAQAHGGFLLRHAVPITEGRRRGAEPNRAKALQMLLLGRERPACLCSIGQSKSNGRLKSVGWGNLPGERKWESVNK